MSPGSESSQKRSDISDEGIFSPPKAGLSPLAVICLLSAVYFFFSLNPATRGALNVFCLGTYCFPLATLAGSLALREMKESRGAIRGRFLVYSGYALIAIRLFYIIFTNL